MNKIGFVFFISLAYLSNIACGNNDPKASKSNGILPSEQHPVVFQTALQFLGSYHYNKPQINDEFAAKAFDNYLDNLDPQRVYFLQSDIQSFQQYRNSIDDAMLTGNITFLFDMYNLYHKRLLDRIDFAKSLLKDSFDFKQVDSFSIDREDMKWEQDFVGLDALWRRKVKYECLTIASSGKFHKEYSQAIMKRYENLEKMVQKTKSEDVFQLILNSISEIFDPHTNYFSPRSAEDFAQSMSLSLEGIGAQLQTENEYTKVREIIKGGPADRSRKLHAGDRIIGVAQGDADMVNVIDWRIDEVVALIRGKKGTPVRLEIIPVNEPNKTKIISLVRDKIVLEEQSAKSSVKEVYRNGKKIKVGVITIPTFYMDFNAAQRGEKNYKSTTRDVKKLLTDLKKQKISGLIIDLRNNGGGSLQESVELTGLFIKDGPVVQVKDMMGGLRVEQDRDNGEVMYDGPLVVMVNRFSASASEIFAAAIQDYNRGIVVGERTFGKGTVQQVEDLNNYIKMNNVKVGQVKFTLAKFYRINGSSTQHKGVTPDIQLPGLFDGRKYGEDANPNAMAWDQIKSSTYIYMNPNLLKREVLLSNHKTRLASNKEFEYLQEDIETVKKLESRKYVTLNLEEYKAENDKADQAKKARDEYRKQHKTKNEDREDLILSESEEVIADLLDIK